MENNTYHPHLYHYSVGVSVGGIIIVYILNARYLYETQSTKIALDYIDELFKFLKFDTLRSIFFDTGNGKELSASDPFSILNNLITDGSFCQREQLVDILQGNHKDFKFNNRKQYFKTKEYQNWLLEGRNLDNVFIVCYSLKQTKMCVFTGNKNRFLSGVNFIDYELLTPDNLIEAVLCSSAIIGLYPSNNINRDKAIDGAASEINQFVHLQILCNIANHISSNLIHTPALLFFGIRPETNNDFTIITNKLNIQNRYENIQEFTESSIPILTTLFTVQSVASRIQYNASVNVPLTSMCLTQPFVKQFSVNNITKNILGAYKQKSIIMADNKDILLGAISQKRIPTFLLQPSQFNADIFGMKRYFKNYKHYKKTYANYNPIISSMIMSTFFHKKNTNNVIRLLDKNYNEINDENGKPVELTLNLYVFDAFARHTYDLTATSLELELLTKRDKGTLDILCNLGYVMGNIMYDIHIRQSLYTSTNVTCDCIKPFANDITVIPALALQGFLGPNQS